jgi:fatty-acyl-CoA synthase
MDGYWKDDDLTEEAFRYDWLHTGDLARQDDEGYLTIVDRVKDMIVTGGFNVYAKEVEDIIATHSAVSSCAVIGVPDREWGEAVKAIVVLNPGADIEAEEITSLVREVKGPIWTPKSVDFVQEILLTAVGKPDKKLLRSNYWDGGGPSGQRLVN